MICPETDEWDSVDVITRKAESRQDVVSCDVLVDGSSGRRCRAEAMWPILGSQHYLSPEVKRSQWTLC
jgi:hypothetical protein